MFDPTQQA